MSWFSSCNNRMVALGPVALATILSLTSCADAPEGSGAEQELAESSQPLLSSAMAASPVITQTPSAASSATGAIATAPILSRAPATGCADGTVEQVFGRGMVGCAGAVTYPNRASLCAAGYHPVSARGFHFGRNATVPAHHYWTNDDLRYGGSGSGSCTVQYQNGSVCPSNQPMRVCATTNSDPEGNSCNWVSCSFEGSAGYFGGCVGNATAGTLCVQNTGCADGTVEQTFAQGTIGCAGAVSYANAASLCTAGFVLASPSEWNKSRGMSAPTHNYWTAFAPPYYTGSSGACQVSGFTSSGWGSCPTDSPMRVCVPSGNDPEGNHCNWTNCSYSGNAANDYFGGCVGNLTAGALCMPEGCADGTSEQTWSKFVYGCAGHVSHADASSLCNARGIPVNAGLWTSFRGNLPPTHNYWTYEVLNWAGMGPASCSANRSGGATCGIGSSMGICTDSGNDAESNHCNWTHCGLDANTPDQYLGGCASTAGVLCMTGP